MGDIPQSWQFGQQCIQTWGLLKPASSIFCWNGQASILLKKHSHSEMFWGDRWPLDREICWMKRCWVSALHSLRAAHTAKAPLKHVTVRNVNFNTEFTFAGSLYDGTCICQCETLSLLSNIVILHYYYRFYLNLPVIRRFYKNTAVPTCGKQYCIWHNSQ